ncbi:MAG: polyribonucleotide nucleotidyltransferase [Deltaproteobacteria bacterium]|nr:polyribonucleotide nucleotidyltransferase [Deltaproteobacteria bacterium]
MNIKETLMVGGRPLTIETGKVARQADGAVVITHGDTVVLVTAVSERVKREGLDFFPLTVNYQEMTFAAGKIPGGFFKREGKPSERETLISRLIDRPIRPLFPKGYKNETQIIATVLSFDQENDPSVLGILGASASLGISDIPFEGPIAAARVGRINGEFIAFPTEEQLAESDIDLVVAGNRDAVLMVEAGAKFASEDDMVTAILFGHRALQPLIEVQEKLVEKLGVEKREFEPESVEESLVSWVKEKANGLIREALLIPVKKERQQRLKEVYEEIVNSLPEEFEDQRSAVKGCFEDLEREILRSLIVKEKRRIDGRSFTEIRPVSCEVGVLPRTHGSAIFTRGETQALVVTTFGTSEDEQKIDTITEEGYKSFMLHYNFPPYCVGEASRLGPPSRREIGHGALAERALKPVVPDETEFPYTIRVVSEILESNGSSSMATVCGTTLSLMDAGVPISQPIAGIAMGLIEESGEIVILSDIMGDEDHSGDMDFKVAGGYDGITALQMDIKISGISEEILKKALYQAKEGRQHILNIMRMTLDKPREALSKHAPRITTLEINPDKIREVIGPGGKVIRGIVEKTGVKIDIEDGGIVKIVSTDAEKADEAIKIIKEIVQEAEIGKIYEGKVRKVVNFGAFVEIFPGTDGLVHISQLSDERVRDIFSYIKEGDIIPVKVIDIDRDGKIKLSRKAALKELREKKDQ